MGTLACPFAIRIDENNISEANCSGIYCISNKTSGKVYIGSSKNIRKRIRKHFSELRKNIHYNRYLQSAYNKYGKTNFNIYVLEKVDVDSLLLREQYYLDDFKCYEEVNGYNLSKNSNAPSKSLELLESLKIKMRGSGNPFFGKKHSDKTRALMERAINEEEKNLLIKLYNDSVPLKEMRKQLNMSDYLIHKILHKNNIPTRKRKFAKSRKKYSTFCIDCNKELYGRFIKRCKKCYHNSRRKVKNAGI